MSGKGDVNILATDLRDKLAARNVAVEIDFVVFDLRLALSDYRIRRSGNGGWRASSTLRRERPSPPMR